MCSSLPRHGCQSQDKAQAWAECVFVGHDEAGQGIGANASQYYWQRALPDRFHPVFMNLLESTSTGGDDDAQPVVSKYSPGHWVQSHGVLGPSRLCYAPTARALVRTPAAWA